MEDMVFTHNWFLKQPKAVEKIKLDWTLLIEQHLNHVAVDIVKPDFEDIEGSILTALELVPLRLHGTPDTAPLDFVPLDLSLGQANNRPLYEVGLSYSGSGSLWRQKPLDPFTPIARGRVLESQIIFKFYCRNSHLAAAYDTLYNLVEQMRLVLPSHQPLINDHNAELRKFLPKYVAEHEERIRILLEPWKLDLTMFDLGRRIGL